MTKLELKAGHDALEKIASTRDPVKAISEFVWNALDSDASEIYVEFGRNTLGGIEAITIRDNGNGMTLDRASADFQNLGNSWKRGHPRTPSNRVVHGKEGQGRLRFFSLADKAKWSSVSRLNEITQKISIEILAESLHRSEVEEIAASPNDANSGTIVELYPLKETFDWLVSDEARADFTSIFAPYVMQYPDVGIHYDGQKIDPTTMMVRSKEFPIHNVVCPERTVEGLVIKIIEWKSSVGGRKIHFGKESGVVLGSMSANVTAPGFDYSAYAYAPFFQEIADANLLEVDGLTDKNFAHVVEHIRTEIGDYFRSREAEKSSGLIEELKTAGVYPYRGDPKDEVEKRERQVFDIAVHAVASYSRDFKKTENSQKKISLGLIREAMRHNPESMHNILHQLFNLPKNRQDEFSNLLKRTNLGNIITASTLISDRIVALEVLKEIVFNKKHSRTVKERGELDVLVQNNTWLFGESFHITLAETGLSKIMERVSIDLNGSSSKVKIRKPDGKTARADSFLGRVVPGPNEMHREYLLIELKRPSLTIGRKETDQLEDYMNAIRDQPDFINTSTHWTFFLITGNYDDTVKERITQENRVNGVLYKKPTYTV